MRTLLIGDSITEYIPKDLLDIDWSYNLKKNLEEGKDFEFYKSGTENYTAKMIQDYVFKHIDASKFDQIVLQCGINNFFWPFYDEDYKAQSPEEIAAEIIAFANHIKTQTQAKLYLQSLYPTHSHTVTPVEAILKINRQLAMFCKQNNIEYFDMHSLLSDKNGEMRNDLSDDGLHPNREGYKLVCEALKSKLKSKPEGEESLQPQI